MKSKMKTDRPSAAKPLRGKKTWREKLQDDKDLPKLVACREKDGNGMMVIPAPRQVDALMKRVPRGALTTIDNLRTALAMQHDAATACPITTGIFAWMAAYAADEASEAGESKITPYWRTLKSGGEINPKYPGGIAAVSARLQAEGHEVVQRRKRFFVRDFEQQLARL